MGDFARESVENEVAAPVCCYNQTLSVIGEFYLCPFALLTSEESLLELEQVEACKGRLVVVAHVVEQDRLRSR